MVSSMSLPCVDPLMESGYAGLGMGFYFHDIDHRFSPLEYLWDFSIETKLRGSGYGISTMGSPNVSCIEILWSSLSFLLCMKNHA